MKELDPTKHYVVGFAFVGDQVLLIRKNRPASQVGKLNGPGGRLEDDDRVEAQKKFVSGTQSEILESSRYAMAREFSEETGVLTDHNSWTPFNHFNDAQGWTITFLYGRFSAIPFRSMTDEQVAQVALVPVRDVTVHRLNSYNFMPNLTWLIPQALTMEPGASSETTKLFTTQEVSGMTLRRLRLVVP